MVQEVTLEKDFEESVLSAGLPAMVAFTAVWCGPCAWLTPYLEEVAEEGKGRLEVRTLDVDQVPVVAERYRIGSVPIVILFVDGEERDRSVGVEPHRIREMAETAFAGQGKTGAGSKE